MYFAKKMTQEIKAMNKQVRNKTHKARGALTAVSIKRRENTQTNRQTMATVSETLHKTSKINLRN